LTLRNYSLTDEEIAVVLLSKNNDCFFMAMIFRQSGKLVFDLEKIHQQCQPDYINLLHLLLAIASLFECIFPGSLPASL